MKALKEILKKVPGLHAVWVWFHSVRNLNERLKYLEKRLYNYRWFAVEMAADYLVGAQIEGDYCEFGVWKGTTFAHMLRYHEIFPEMRFFAMDSFEGLPAPTGIDCEDGYTSNFSEGEFACDEEGFLDVLRQKKLPLDRVVTVPGWFSDTLNDDMGEQHGLKKIACAWIDCDFYESTVPVLDFLTSRLSVGSLVIFDDWGAYRNLPDRGQQKAFAEWVERNPDLELRHIFDFSHFGKAFTVSKVPA